MDNNISEFCDLVELVFQMNNNDWIDIITCRNTMFLSAYLKSRYFRSQQMDQELYNPFRRKHPDE